jgi:hypothetical protein
MEEARRLAMRRAHASRVTYCTCGKLPRGNGGRAAHAAMHKRLGDGHYGMTYSTWCDAKAGKIPWPQPKEKTQ